MATQLQFRKGSSLDNDAFTGAEAEMTYDTTTGGLRIHDGATQGGFLVDSIVYFQKPTALNNYTWARKYSSGWVEQGGFVTIPSAKYIDVVFPVTMADANYTPMVTGAWSDTAVGQNEGAQNLSTTGMRVTSSYASVEVWWRVEGMAA